MIVLIIKGILILMLVSSAIHNFYIAIDSYSDMVSYGMPRKQQSQRKATLSAIMGSIYVLSVCILLVGMH